MLPKYLDTTCTAGPDGRCDGACGDVIRQRSDTGRWYITINHAGFNTQANNGAGYSTRAIALAVHTGYRKRGAAARRKQREGDEGILEQPSSPPAGFGKAPRARRLTPAEWTALRAARTGDPF